tara:strand:+ start:18175 stop:19236 length:1062 start_codon:yes stop_codon:yes gene_type:complete
MKDLKLKLLENQQISKISSQLLENLPLLLDTLEIQYIEYPNRIAFPCPVHGGDNAEGCSIFTDGNTAKGNWNCWTHSCEEDFTTNLFGFVRGVLSHRKGEKVSMFDAANFALKFLNTDLGDLKTYKLSEANKDIKLLEIFEREPPRENVGISREQILKSIEIPSKYYINRGYSKEVLETFDVGLCIKKNKPMSRRVVVPIYDEDYNYVGCIGRSTSENMQPKWLHSRGFRKSSYLYGLNVAKESIMNTQTAVLVEGQGDVWRLHEAGITNAVGIFGASLSEDQLILLEKSGALNLVILTDTDEAGEKAAQQIVKRGGRRFNYHRPAISKKDVGEMTIQEIQEEILNNSKGVLS